MDDYSKYQLAIELIEEKLNRLYKELDTARTYNRVKGVKAKIKEAIEEKNEIMAGNIRLINKIIAENEKGQPEN